MLYVNLVAFLLVGYVFLSAFLSDLLLLLRFQCSRRQG